MDDTNVELAVGRNDGILTIPFTGRTHRLHAVACGGAGDVIYLARYLPALRRHTSRLSLCCFEGDQHALLGRLLAHFADETRILPMIDPFRGIRGTTVMLRECDTVPQMATP